MIRLRKSLSVLPRRAVLICLLMFAIGTPVRIVDAQPAPMAIPPNPVIQPCAPPPSPKAMIDLWAEQDVLIGKCMALMPASVTDRPNIYAVAVNPHGSQFLFSREAKTALQRLATLYGGTARAGILLSNSAADILQVPFATQQNIAAVLSEIGRRTQASPNDVLFIYLTSHGGPDAVLESGLPGNVPILAISARSLADALAQSRVRRRVIIVSACFAGSWIPALANDDTIIITAARFDRTSFGCAEDRPLTYFGEAFLNGPFSRGASLADSFEGARKTVTQWEEAQRLPTSEPQMFVGKNMESFWIARPGQPPAKATSRKVAAKR